MRTNIISQKYGWYLARINASIEKFANIVAISFKTIGKYNLKAGQYIKIRNFNNVHSEIEYLDKFILLPYFKEIIENYWVLHDVIQSITKKTYQYVDKEYFNVVTKLLNTFFQERNNKRGVVIKEFLEFDNQETSQMDIAMPESWLNEKSVDLGDIVLLRNDMASPVIY
ncbi:MAG: hypothetical protein ACFE9S_18250 [Candidatus Hermodarchaeota archaeon]